MAAPLLRWPLHCCTASSAPAAAPNAFSLRLSRLLTRLHHPLLSTPPTPIALCRSSASHSGLPLPVAGTTTDRFALVSVARASRGHPLLRVPSVRSTGEVWNAQTRSSGARPHLRLSTSVVRASSSSVEGEAGAGEEEEDLGTVIALGPQDLQSFFEMNAGQWRGHFLQFDFEGQQLQRIPVSLTGATTGEGDLSNLKQTLRVKPGPQGATAGADEASVAWGEWQIPEMNRITVDRQQVGFFASEGAYALSHVTAEMLGHVLRVGVLGEGADPDDEDPKGVKMPSTRPALVSEVCLSSHGSRARAFHVLDPRGVIDTISVFVETKGEESLVPELDTAFNIGQLLGTWEGNAEVARSDLYGGTKEVQAVKTVYTAEGDSVTVESTRGARTIRSKGRLDSTNVLHYDGNVLQTTFLPGGLSFSYPKLVPRGSSFFFEFSWTLPDASSRQRIIRTFDPDGMVVSTALLSESRTV